MLELTKDNFAATVKENDTVFVDCWATWCGPCRQYGPIFEKVAGQKEGVVFAKLDTDAEQELAGAFGIQSIPTTLAFRGGYLVFAQPGAMNAQQLGAVVDQVSGLDLEELKREAAQQDTAQA